MKSLKEKNVKLKLIVKDEVNHVKARTTEATSVRDQREKCELFRQLNHK